ncbi:hypothetical protein BDW42DRAFT_169102 [Aspergillus taichungensis]|uniref:DUF7580 domain-containing protein n=1 Tax=Aspergillus taichungensis TaxID=482145 RepID=A0A2J5HV57_9EURO|nr:hypothetical protein BDW42DRAFT_169102 [Aspergillus taichungensis]
MSGLEIGGLVLAVFPIVISVIRGYQVSIEVLHLWETSEYQNEIQSIQLEMEVQETLFRNTYVGILRAFMDQHILIKILMKPDGLQKNQTAITNHLKVYLGSKWPMYSKLMERLHNSLNALQLHLKKTTPLNASDWVSKVHSALRPIRFSFNIRQRQGLLHRIKEDNNSFRMLVEQRHAMKVLQQPLEHHLRVIELRKLREQTCSLSDTLSSNIKTSNSDGHRTLGLFLRCLVSPSSQDGRGILHSTQHQSACHIWIEDPMSNPVQRAEFVEIECRSDECHPDTPWKIWEAGDHFPTRPCCCPPRRESKPPPLYLHRFGKFSTFALPEQQPELKIVRVCLIPPESPRPPLQLTEANRAAVASSPHKSLGLVQAASPCAYMSLHDILSSSQKFTRFPRYFFEMDRAVLAATIAATVLCLHGSPWVEPSLSNRNIFITIVNGDFDNKTLLNPFFKMSLQAADDSLPPVGLADPSSCSQPNFGIRNRHLYNLGIILLELVMNEPLSAFQISKRMR